MTHNHLKKGPSLETMLEGHTAHVDSSRAVEVVGGNKFKVLFDQYQEFLEIDFNSTGFNYQARYITFAQVKTVLSPKEINAFLKTTIINEDHSYYCRNTSLFLSGLIQASFNDGNEFFDLNVQGLKPLEGVGAFLCRTREHPYSVRVKGNVAGYFGINSGGVKFYLDGDTDKFCGSLACNSKFYISGNVSRVAGFGSSDCLFDLRGKVDGLHLTNAKGSTVLISDPESFKRISEYHTKTPHVEALEYNGVYFVHPDNTKELLVVEK
ncbi:hypothetical protein HOA91_02225 [Candidatus Woesearchaeota archaeon]|jgi:hypothetical protein|nr:hypothetical protein [Candidatus Woesearchaeota archaeon]